MKTRATFHGGAAAATAALGLLLAVAQSHADIFHAWPYRMKITFDNDGAIGTLTNFPALVVLGAGIPNFSYDQFVGPGDGRDLRFADATETVELYCEIEKWNSGGQSLVWVQVPTWQPGAEIYAYWGRGGTTAPAYTTNGATWSEGYAGVWHLAETGGTVAKDSSPTAHAGTLNNMEDADWVSGRIGGGVNLDGVAGGNEYVRVGAVGIAAGASRTIYGWAKCTDMTWPSGVDPWIGVFGFTAGAGAHSLFSLDWSRDGGPLKGAVKKYQIGVDSTWIDVTDLDLNWHFFVGTYAWDGSKYAFKAYLDGVSKGTGSRTDTPTMPDDFYLGHQPAQGTYFVGVLDEVRVANVVRSPGWIRACWRTMGDNAAFESYGTVEQRGVEGGALILVR